MQNYPCLIMVSLVKGFLNCPQSSEAQTEWGKLVHLTTENQLYAYMLNMSEVVFLRCPESSSMMGMRWTWERYWGGEGLCFFFCFVFNSDLFKRLYREVLVFMGYDCHQGFSLVHTSTGGSCLKLGM